MSLVQSICKRHFYCGKAGTFLMLNKLFICLFWASLIAKSVENLPAMPETQVRSLGREDALEKEMATHSSILAWRISWMEESGGLQFMGLQESDTS